MGFPALDDVPSKIEVNYRAAKPEGVVLPGETYEVSRHRGRSIVVRNNFGDAVQTAARSLDFRGSLWNFGKLKAIELQSPLLKIV
jgi:hypothetical protein